MHHADTLMFQPRYRYRPVQTQRFTIDLHVKSEFNISGEIQNSATHLHAEARAIPFKIDSADNMHFMMLLSDGYIKQNVNGTADSSDLTIYATKRVELVMSHSGVIKQVFEIEKLPSLPITGYANPDENGLRILLSSFFPRLPDSISSVVLPVIAVQDSSITTYPDKTVKRQWQDKTTYSIVTQSDSSATFAFDARFTAVNIIYPQKISPAKVSDDQSAAGSFVLTHEGTLLDYSRNTTIYRSMQSMESPGSARIEETTTINFKLKKI